MLLFVIALRQLGHVGLPSVGSSENLTSTSALMLRARSRSQHADYGLDSTPTHELSCPCSLPTRHLGLVILAASFFKSSSSPLRAVGVRLGSQ